MDRTVLIRPDQGMLPLTVDVKFHFSTGTSYDRVRGWGFAMAGPHRTIKAVIFPGFHFPAPGSFNFTQVIGRTERHFK
jgi:hypothetical protein